MECPKCGREMMRSDLYDSEGVIGLYPNIYKDGYYWFCHNRGCEDGQRSAASTARAIFGQGCVRAKDSSEA